MRQLDAHVSIGGVSANIAAGLEYFDVSVHGVQVFYVIQAGDAQSAVDRADVFDVHAVRNMNGVFDSNFHAFVLGVVRGDRHGIRTRAHLNRDAVEVGFLPFRSFHGMNFDFVAVPPFHVNGAVDVLQLERATRLQGNRLIEVLADGVAGNDAKCGEEKRAKTKNRRAESVP
jgi:hypothetical protein